MSSSIVKNPLKLALRKRIKKELLALTPENKRQQSDAITKKLLNSNAFKQSARISVYLSLSNEVNTNNILAEMFSQQKQVFVPSYSGNRMVMLKINDMNDFESLPMTKWNIRQPNDDGSREDATETGGLDLILMPGVAFSRDGGRLGHGMGYYDRFLHEYFARNPTRHIDSQLLSTSQPLNIDEMISRNKTILFGLAFNEQLIDNVPIDETDVLLHEIITATKPVVS